MAAADEYRSARTVALLTLLAHTGLRINEALSRDVEDLGHDRGHRVLRLERKGDVKGKTVLTAPVARAIDVYLGDRTSGPIFVTTTGRRMRQPEAWRMVPRIARRASLDGAGEIRPHSLRVAFITGAREAGVPWKMSRTPPGTPTLGPLAATTEDATPSIATPRMPSLCWRRNPLLDRC